MIDQLELNFDAPKHDDTLLGKAYAYLEEHHPEMHWWKTSTNEEIRSMNLKDKTNIYIRVVAIRNEYHSIVSERYAVGWFREMPNFAGGSCPCKDLEELERQVTMLIERLS